MHQLNRGPENRDDKRPALGDLRDSGNLEQDAAVVGFVYRPEYYLERKRYDDAEKERIRIATLEKRRNKMEFLLPKNRNGATGTVEMNFFAPSNALRDTLGAKHEEHMFSKQDAADAEISFEGEGETVA
jgi:replicative DNA helicase